MGLQCLNSLVGLGSACDADNPFAVDQGLFLTTEDFEFATAADFATKAKWDAGVIAKTIFPLLDINEVEDQSEDDVIYTSPSTGAKSSIRDGKRGSRYKLQLPLELHKILRTYSYKKWRIFKYDLNGNIKGTSPDGTKITGISVIYFKVGKMMPATADAPAFSVIEIQESDGTEWDDRGVYVTPTWSPSSVLGVTKLELSQVGSASGTDIVVDAFYNNGYASDGSVDQIAYSGLTTGDSWVIDELALTVASVTESSTVPGRYTVTASGAVSGGDLSLIPYAGFPVEADAITYS